MIPILRSQVLENSVSAAGRGVTSLLILHSLTSFLRINKKGICNDWPYGHVHMHIATLLDSWKPADEVLLPSWIWPQKSFIAKDKNGMILSYALLKIEDDPRVSSLLVTQSC